MKVNLRKIGIAMGGVALAATMFLNNVSAGTFHVTSVPYASATSVNKTKTTNTKSIGCTAKLTNGNPRTVYVYVFDSNSQSLAPIVKAKEDAGKKVESYYSGKTGEKGKNIIVSYRDSTGTGFGSFSTDATIDYY